MEERFWLLNRPPTVFDPAEFRVDDAVTGETASELASWSSRNRDASCLRLLFLAPKDYGNDGMTCLLKAFAKARIEVYGATLVMGELAKFDPKRIDRRPVGSGRTSWLWLAGRLMVMRPTPTIFVSGKRRLRQARFLSLLWPFSDTVVVSKIDYLVCAFQKRGESAKHRF
jgi:hypothetical protein